jgi:hypothetical protein
VFHFATSPKEALDGRKHASEAFHHDVAICQRSSFSSFEADRDGGGRTLRRWLESPQRRTIDRPRHRALPLLGGGERPVASDRTPLAGLDVLTVKGQPLPSGDRLQILRRFLLVAVLADGRQAIRIIRIVMPVAEAEGRAVIEDDGAEDQMGVTVGAMDILALQDLTPQAYR